MEEAAVAAHVARVRVGPGAEKGAGHGAVVAERLEVPLRGGAHLAERERKTHNSRGSNFVFTAVNRRKN